MASQWKGVASSAFCGEIRDDTDWQWWRVGGHYTSNRISDCSHCTGNTMYLQTGNRLLEIIKKLVTNLVVSLLLYYTFDGFGICKNLKKQQLL